MSRSLEEPSTSPPLGLCSARLNPEDSCFFFILNREVPPPGPLAEEDAGVVGLHRPPWGGESYY